MDKDEIYLNHLSNLLISGSQWRLNYLGFLITINIALFGAIYFLDNHQLWVISGAKMFLVFLLIFVNIIFTLIYLREHNQAVIIKKEFFQYLQTGWEGGAGHVAKHMRPRIDGRDAMRGWTWELTKILFAVFNAVPLTYLIFLLFINSQKNNFMGNEFTCAEGMILAILLLISFVIHMFLSCKEAKENN
jgi:hypothetical protein